MKTKLIRLTAAIVAHYVRKQKIDAADLGSLISDIYVVINRLTDQKTPESRSRSIPSKTEIRLSITRDYLISFEDGKPYRSLLPHLNARGLTPTAYRIRWNLPGYYPMVAQSLSNKRSELAKARGLGHRHPSILMLLVAVGMYSQIGDALALTLPKVTKGLRYSEARNRLIQSGYAPYPLDLKENGEDRCMSSRASICQAFREARSCSTNGRARCVFVMRYLGTDIGAEDWGMLVVETAGASADPQVEKFRFLDAKEISDLLHE